MLPNLSSLGIGSAEALQHGDLIPVVFKNLDWRAHCSYEPFNRESSQAIRNDGVKKQLLANLYSKMGLSRSNVAPLAQLQPDRAFRLACKWMQALDKWARYRACRSLIDRYAYAMDEEDAITNHAWYCQELKARIGFLLDLSTDELDKMVRLAKISRYPSSRKEALVALQPEEDLEVQGLCAKSEYHVLFEVISLWQRRQHDDLLDWIEEKAESKYSQIHFKEQMDKLLSGIFDWLHVDVKWTGVATDSTYDEKGEFDFNEELEKWMPTIVQLFADEFVAAAISYSSHARPK